MTETPASRGESVRDPAAVSRFIEDFAQVLVDSGMPRVPSRILVALVATDSGRLTAGELAEQLRASPAAISGGVRYLVDLQMIRRGREPGARRDHYWVDRDIWYQTITQRDQVLVRWVQSLREGAAALGPDTPAGARFVESVEFFEFLVAELKQATERWDKRRAERAAAADDARAASGSPPDGPVPAARRPDDPAEQGINAGR